MKENREPTVQEVLEGLKKRQREISELMRNSPLGGGSEDFTKLFLESETVEREIQKIEDSITPAGPPGAVSQFTIDASRGPEDRRKTTTTKKH
jgi:uncharacterized protein YdcH (DUF465 family)